MRLSVCVGNYAKTPYCIPGLDINVYCMEELCYGLKENAFLLDMSLLEDGLIHWIEQECGMKELARSLYPLVHKQGSLSGFVVKILTGTGFYDGETTAEVEKALKQGAGLSGIEKRKSQIDYLVKKKKYVEALRGYDWLIKRWEEKEAAGEPLPAAECYAAILHNKGAAFAGLMDYSMAGELFRAAYDKSLRPEYYIDYLAARRMQLSESEYVAFAAEKEEGYQYTLELEKKMELLTREWEEQPDYLMLNHRRELRSGGEKQRYYEENERITQVLKDNYRRSICE